MYAVGFVTAPILYAIYYFLSSRKLLCFSERLKTDTGGFVAEDQGKFVAEKEDNSKAIGLSRKL
jgi:hypothetical protein